MTVKTMMVVKFGGSTFPPDRLYEGFCQARDYLLQRHKDDYMPMAVVSAPKEVSDILITAYKDKDLKVAEKLRKMYSNIMTDELDQELGRIKEVLESGARDQFLSLGENHSGIVLSGLLRERGIESSYLDGREAGAKVSPYGRVDINESVDDIGIVLKDRKLVDSGIHVIGGYVGASTEDGSYRLMGRNSTDITMSLVAAAIHASSCENIKDTPVRRLQPRIEFNGEEPIEIWTSVIEGLSYNEALHMGSRQSEVLHPTAVKIAKNGRRDIFVMQLGNDQYTHISTESDTTPDYPVAAISARVCNVMSISDSSMDIEDGIGYIHAVSGAFKDSGINILDMSGPGSIMSFTFPTIQNKTCIDVYKIRSIMQKCLRDSGFSPDDVKVERRVALSIVGDAMSGKPGVLRRVLEPFEECGVSIRMASQSDEAESPPCIDLYIDPDREQTERVLRTFCERFKFFNNK